MTDLIDQNLKKHVAAVHINNRLTLTQRKASNVLLYNAYENLLTARVHRIRVKDLAEAIGFNTNNLEPLKDALRTLARTVLEWNILDENGSHEEWGATTLLAQAVIRHGYCIYAYSPDLCEKLYRPEIYALLNLSIQRKFSSSYALALYENCLRYRRVGSTGWIGLDNLKRLMGINESDAYYEEFRKFNDKVIKPATRQVNDTSDLFLDIEYQRTNRKVSAVRFQVTDNPQMLLFAERQAALAAALEAQVEAAMPQGQPGSGSAPIDPEVRLERLREALQELGLNSRQIRRALASHDPAYLEGNIAIVRHDLAAGKVQNLPAYLLSALRHDYRPVVAYSNETSSTGLVVNNSTGDAGIRQMSPQTLEELRAQFQNERINVTLERLSAAQRQTLEQDYVTYLEQNSGFEMRLILDRYRKNGLSSRMVESHFRAFVESRLKLDWSEAEFATYIADRQSS